MKTLSIKNLFLHAKKLLVFLLFVCSLFFFTSCKKQTEYFDYVSELRSNIFLAQTETCTLRIYSVQKETPYKADGVKKEMCKRTEIYFLPASGAQSCHISFTVKGESLGGEMSYDNVKSEYYYSCGVDVSTLSNIPCVITYGDENIELNALSVLSSSVLTPKKALQSLVIAEKELFSSLTDKYGFIGEIYMRLLFEDSPYYYVGIIDREGKTHAFLLNATSGKVLAKRQS